ncbi:MAG: N-acetyl sugar amidotransferase [Fibrobacteria bacterium]|nr:N-acetyl sugar amidotransferase [Fibrobacteria bacterium]
MKYCTKCVQPDTRPGIVYDENGVCGGCQWTEQKESINWKERENELREIAEEAKNARTGVYDCVIGVSGGKDSTFQSLYARDVLGLRPLLVNSEPEGITDIGVHNIENLKQHGFDVIGLRPNPKVMKQLITKDFFRYLNPAKVTEYSLWSSTYIIAEKFDIKLIIQGENPGLTLGVQKTTGTGGNALNANEQNTIAKNCYDEYVGEGVDERDLFLFNYNREKLIKQGTRGVWLNYYVKDWYPSTNARFSMSKGLHIRPKTTSLHDLGSYRRFSQLDGTLLEVNQLLKYIKFGFGQANDAACYDIRAGNITREEGIALVKEFDGGCGEHNIETFCKYIDISIAKFWETVEPFRGDMWEKDSSGQWVLKAPIWKNEPVNSNINIPAILERIEI